ncbi:MAG: type II secretion system protein GspC [Pseudomonadota bacterium]
MSTIGSASLDNMRQLGGHPFWRSAQQHGPRIVTIVLALWLAWLLASVVWQLIPQREDAPIKAPVAAQPITGGTSSSGGVDVAPIISASLFGIADIKDETPGGRDPIPPTPPDDLPVASGLQLKGTLASSSENNALAIISDGREEKLYSLSDSNNTIKPGITLHSVQARSVVVNERGVFKKIELPEPDENSPARPTPRRTTQRAPTPRRDVKQVLTENVTQFTQIVSPRPYFVGGQQRGYRLYPGRDRQKFAALGLRPGDIVTEIDGTALNNPTQGAQIFNSLADAQSVSVTIERNGKQQNLTLDIAQLESAGQEDE